MQVSAGSVTKARGSTKPRLAGVWTVSRSPRIQPSSRVRKGMRYGLKRMRRASSKTRGALGVSISLSARAWAQRGCPSAREWRDRRRCRPIRAASRLRAAAKGRRRRWARRPLPDNHADDRESRSRRWGRMQARRRSRQGRTPGPSPPGDAREGKRSIGSSAMESLGQRID